MKNKIIALTLFFLLFLSFAASNAQANDKSYDNIVRHLKTKYHAKKVGIPMMWLARFAVKIVRPAGVKSFNLTMFENLSVSRDTLDAEMQAAMRNSLSAEWSPIFRVHSRAGQQAYLYLSEAGKDVKILLVTIDANNQAAVIRAKFSPDKLAEFIDNPKILGISLADDQTGQNSGVENEKNNSQPEIKPFAPIRTRSGSDRYRARSLPLFVLMKHQKPANFIY